MTGAIEYALLVGPTGSGKTPLGELLVKRGLWGHPCVHLDFGARLRAIDAGEWQPETLAPADLEIIANSLRTGALLRDEEFHVAEGILRAVGVEAGSILLLNGLPRHVGQAAAVAGIVDIRSVIVLECPDDVALERIDLDSGGDRGGRRDDQRSAILRRLANYRDQTLPLLQHYAARGARIRRLQVGTTTTAADLAARLVDRSG